MSEPALAAMHEALFAALGADVTVQRGTQRPKRVRAIVSDGVERLGEFGQVIGRARHVSVLRAHWLPQRGDRVTVDGDAQTVEIVTQDNGFVVEVMLHG